MPDLEQQALGQYNDRVLELIDSLMVECLDRGIKLSIAIADTCASEVPLDVADPPRQVPECAADRRESWLIAQVW